MEDLDNDPILQKYKFPDPNSVNSDKKRLAAINEKLESEKASKQLIKSALSGQVLNKKIVFNNPIQPKKVKKEEPKHVPESDPSPMSKKLFDDDDGLDGNDSFKLDIPSKRFKNSKESKLIELQSRFAHDPRFKIDDKFIEDDEDDQNEVVHGDEDNLKKETEKEMDILEEILGKPLKRKAKHTEEKQLTSSIILPRYDPSKPESQKFKIRKVEKLEPYQLPDKNDEEEQGDKPEVSKERFYEISETFKKDFPDEPNEGQSFSLTAMFGRPTAEIPETNDKLGTVKPKGTKSQANIEESKGSKKKLPKLEPSKRSKPKNDSDDEDDGEKEEAFDESSEDEEDSKSKKRKKSKEEAFKKFNDKSDVQQSKSVSKVSNPLLKYERFCFTENDDRLAANSFYDVEKIKRHLNSWKEKKKVMNTALTKKRRHFKHVSKLKVALESGDGKDKDIRTKYRIYKETTKKH